MMKTHAYLSRFVPGLFSGVLCFGFLVPGAFAASPGDPSGAPGMAMKAPAVAAGKVFAVDVLPGRRYSARILSPAVVSITSRVSGEIVEAPFAEGGRVKKGDVLFRLDPVRYEAAVKSAEGARKEAEAELEYAKRSLDRVKSSGSRMPRAATPMTRRYGRQRLRRPRFLRPKLMWRSPKMI